MPLDSGKMENSAYCLLTIRGDSHDMLLVSKMGRMIMW